MKESFQLSFERNMENINNWNRSIFPDDWNGLGVTKLNL